MLRHGVGDQILDDRLIDTILGDGAGEKVFDGEGEGDGIAAVIGALARLLVAVLGNIRIVLQQFEFVLALHIFFPLFLYS